MDAGRGVRDGGNEGGPGPESGCFVLLVNPHPSSYPAFLSPHLQHAPPLLLSGLSVMQSVLCHGPEPMRQST